MTRIEDLLGDSNYDPNSENQTGLTTIVPGVNRNTPSDPNKSLYGTGTSDPSVNLWQFINSRSGRSTPRNPNQTVAQGNRNVNTGWIPYTSRENVRQSGVINKLIRSGARANTLSPMAQALEAGLGEEGPVVSLLRMLGLNDAADSVANVPQKYADNQAASTPQAQANMAEFTRLLNSGQPIPMELLDQDKIDALPFTPMKGAYGENIINSQQLADYQERQKQIFLEEQKYQQWLEDQVGQLEDEEGTPEEETYYPYIGYGGGWSSWGGGGGGKSWIDWFKNLYWNVD